jgi:accessory gene regulator protein AgrB
MANVSGLAVGNAVGGALVDGASYEVTVLCSAAAALLAAAIKAKLPVVSYAPAATDLQELFLQVTDRDEPMEAQA